MVKRELFARKSAKITKCRKHGALSIALFLSPGRESGRNLCPWKTKACEKYCLGHGSGRNRMPTHKNARIAKSKFLLSDRQGFLAQAHKEISSLERRAALLGLPAACRPNASSDIAWEVIAPQLFENHPNVLFYDYTKSQQRMDKYLAEKLPANYTLTYSRKGNDDTYCKAVLKEGGTVAIVFRNKLPKTFWGFPVIDGDEHDNRFWDSHGVIVGLLPKGKMANDKSGFVVG